MAVFYSSNCVLVWLLIWLKHIWGAGKVSEVFWCVGNCHLAVTSLCVWKRESKLSGVSSCKGIVPWGGPQSHTHAYLILIISQRPHFQLLSHWEVQLKHRNSRKTKTFIHTLTSYLGLLEIKHTRCLPFCSHYLHQQLWATETYVKYKSASPK